MVSVSLSVQEIIDLMETSSEAEKVNHSELYLKRLLLLVVMLCILGVAVVTRIVIRPADIFAAMQTTNGTIVTPVNTTIPHLTDSTTVSIQYN